MEYVETVIVIIQKVVSRVQQIVGRVYQQIHTVEMELVNTIIMRTVCYVQKIVEIVLHPLTQFVGMEHVIQMKTVIHVQAIALVLVLALMEKCEII